jgi:hypothetical protein
VEVRRCFLRSAAAEPADSGGPDPASRLLSAQLAREMLTAAPGGFYGLGTIVDTAGGDVEFGHAGEPEGHYCLSMCRVHKATGIVILTNGESGPQVVRAITSGSSQEPHLRPIEL